MSSKKLVAILLLVLAFAFITAFRPATESKEVGVTNNVEASLQTEPATNDENPCEGLKRYTIYYATHAFAHPFFSVMERGAVEGARAACLELVWTQDTEFSIPETVNRVDAAIATHPDLLVVSVVTPDLYPSVKRAAEEGIPVIAINTDPAGKVPYLIYIGSDEYTAGAAAAKQVLAKGTPTKAACFNHQPGSVSLEARCTGWADTLAEAGVESEMVDIAGGATQAEAAADAFFLANPDVNAALALGPGPGEIGAVLNVLEQQGRTGEVALVTFDIGDIALKAVKDGKIIAAIDQQQYLQAYLAAILARGYLDWGLMPGADVLTGPGIVDANNIDQVIAGVKEGTR